jgi:DNA repair exonuclease SbcCD nuclease subunit
VRIAHYADTHLGYRAFSRSDPDGRNSREADVAKAFERTLDQIARVRPDLVINSGDLFHTIRPTNAALIGAFRSVQEFQERLYRDQGRDVPHVIIGGNHDTPRLADTGCALDLLGVIPGVRVVHAGPRVLGEAELGVPDVRLVCLPHAALSRLDEFYIAPTGEAPVEVLVFHGSAGRAPTATFDPVVLSEERIADPGWTYVALGHYHERFQAAPKSRAWYPGSTERLSFGEATFPRGWILFDTAAPDAIVFQDSPLERVFALPGDVDATGLEPSAVDAAIAATLTGLESRGALDGAVIRLRLVNCPREVEAALDWSSIREWQRRALSLRLEISRPARGGAAPGGAPAGTVREELERFVRAARLPAGVDREALVELARRYLDESGEGEAADAG